MQRAETGFIWLRILSRASDQVQPKLSNAATIQLHLIGISATCSDQCPKKTSLFPRAQMRPIRKGAAVVAAAAEVEVARVAAIKTQPPLMRRLLKRPTKRQKPKRLRGRRRPTSKLRNRWKILPASPRRRWPTSPPRRNLRLHRNPRLSRSRPARLDALQFSVNRALRARARIVHNVLPRPRPRNRAVRGPRLRKPWRMFTASSRRSRRSLTTWMNCSKRWNWRSGKRSKTNASWTTCGAGCASCNRARSKCRRASPKGSVISTRIIRTSDNPVRSRRATQIRRKKSGNNHAKLLTTHRKFDRQFADQFAIKFERS